jgi:hypothetical protein
MCFEGEETPEQALHLFEDGSLILWALFWLHDISASVARRCLLSIDMRQPGRLSIANIAASAIVVLNSMQTEK